jgi:hypothetical protein
MVGRTFRGRRHHRLPRAGPGYGTDGDILSVVDGAI